MRSQLAAIFLAIVTLCSGDTLRISELATAAGDGSERMILKTEDDEEELFVKTTALIGDGDVKEAWANPTSGGEIIVVLNEDGGNKLKQATAAMQHGRDRLAIIVDGRLISAPIVHDTLGPSLAIVGFKDKDFNQLDDLARRLAGRPPRPELEDPESTEPPPKIETVPFTEEEYQANKAMREKMGISHIESIPSEEELNRVLRKGMSREEVVKLFGNPYMASDKPHDDDFYFIYQIAPEKRPENPKREMLPDGFKTDFTDGKLSRWSHTYSSTPREEKVVGREEPTLRAILPEMDVSSGDFDFIAYVEGIVVPDPTQSVNKRDLGDLASIVMMLANSLGEDSKEATLNANCDFMKTLSHRFPDVAALRHGAKNGRVSIVELKTILAPYAFGEKELPVISNPTEGGAGRPAIPSKSDSEGGEEPPSESEGHTR